MPDDLPDPEWLAFQTGVKPALRLSLAAERSVDRVRQLQSAGFAAIPAEKTVRWGSQPEQAIVYVARTLEIAHGLREAEAPVFPGTSAKLSNQHRRAAHERVGALLGFPACCVAAFLERVERGVMRRASGGEASEDFVAAEDAVARTKIFHGRLNDLRRRERLWIIPFYPCRYDCDVALQYADRVFAEMVRVTPVASVRLRTALAQPVTVPPGLLVPFDRF
jgi:hypothetical protein